MRKLCCYNLSVYSAGDKKGTCFLWSEIEGKRGSNEISTCLSLYLSNWDHQLNMLYFTQTHAEVRIETRLLQGVFFILWQQYQMSK